MQLLNRLLVISEIFLTPNKDYGEALAEMEDLGDPLQNEEIRQQFDRTSMNIY